MIGNDIIDLKTVMFGSNYRKQRFLDKAFSNAEQEHIKNSEDPYKVICLLWSMKESAYKMYVQQYSNSFFAPEKIACTLISESEGLVSIHDATYKTYSSINIDYIYTIAHSDDFESIYSHCFEVDNATYSEQHKKSYQIILKTFSEKWDIPVKSMRILKNELGVPKLYIHGEEQLISFSITHHGNYCGYAILI